MLNISGKRCVVIGGGPVAERKAAGLLAAGAQLTVVSPLVTPELGRMADAGAIEWLAREASQADVAGAALVFAAAGEREVNRQAAEAARRLGIPVNVADDGENGDFLVPAVLRRGRFVLAAGVSGAGPSLAVRIVKEFAERYGPEYTGYAEALRHIRRTVKSYVADPEERRRLLTAAAEADALEEWRQAEWLAADPHRLLERLRSRAAAPKQEEDKT
jgi:precorrin-2 dehydrogenase / sirohydrochlorin ferrochelatase